MVYKSVKFALLAVSALGAGVAFANGLPQGGAVQEGSASITYAGGGGYILTIDQQSDKAVIDWKSFSVGKGSTVNFNQPSSDSATLNRVTGDFTSEIAGRINANGSVFLVNPNGIMITADGVIDTGGFVASTLDIDNNDFLNGDYTFTKNGKNGVVSNRGHISVDDGGFVALLGGAVKNEGTVRAFVGKVGFAGGEKIVMSFGNSDFLRVEVPTDKWDKLTDSQGNKVSATLDLGGNIDSRGGFIDITVADASDILRQTISIDGVVSANTVSSTDGVISISGGTVGITGNGRITADADYGNAGTIAIEANSIDSSGTVSAAAQNGIGGKIKISLQHGANLNASTRFDVSGRSKGGSLSFIGGLGKQGTKVLGSADFKADSTDGKGGTIDISNKGGLVGLLSGTVSASGKTQGGRIRLGGAFQGGTYDPKTSLLDKNTQNLFVTRWGDNSDLVSAGKTSLGTGVNIDVSSQSGTGGTAILWADNTTNNYAAIDATGATGGGAVEISGKKQVDSFGLKRIKAGNGVILLDPKNVVTGRWGSAFAQVKKISDKSIGGSKPSLSENDYFGSSVSLSDNGAVLAVGARGADSKKGAVYLFTISGSGDNWGDSITQKKKIDQVTVSLDGDDFFGVSVSLSADGTKLAVGAYGDDVDGADSDKDKGAVYLFNITNSGATVKQTQRIRGNVGGLTLNRGDKFGGSVSLSDNAKRLAVGADNDGNNKGAVYLFTIDGSGDNWGDVDSSDGSGKVTQVKKITNGVGLGNSDLVTGDWFGSSVSLSADGTRLAVGAYGDDGPDNTTGASGAVYLFTITGNGNSWGNTVTKVKTIRKDTPLADGGRVAIAANASFGGGVSLSDDGAKLAVGASGYFVNSKYLGAVYLFTVDWNSQAITQTKIITDSGIISLSSSDSFGKSVSLSDDGTKLAVGATGDDDGVSDGGAVYLINVSRDTDTWATTLNGGTSLKIVAGNDITIDSEINAVTGDGNLEFIAGRSITINAHVKVKGNLKITANYTGNDVTVPNAIAGGLDGKLQASDREDGKAEITVASDKIISSSDGNVIIKMQTGNGNVADKKQTGKITVWKAAGDKVSIIHSGTADANNDSEIVIRSGGEIKATVNSLNEGDTAIELVADAFKNQSGSATPLAIDDADGRYLVWTKSPAGNEMGGITPLFSQYSLTHNKTEFYLPTGDKITDKRSGFIYSSTASTSGNGGGGGGGGGAAVVVLVGAGVAIAMGGIGGGTAAAAGAGAAGAAGAGATGAGAVTPPPVGSIDTLFNTGIYAHLNGIDMQALYQPQKPLASVFHTPQPQQVTYKAKTHRTYDMTILAHNIKAQKAIPLYELDEKLYETIKHIFVQQSTATKDNTPA